MTERGGHGWTGFYQHMRIVVGRFWSPFLHEALTARQGAPLSRWSGWSRHSLQSTRYALKAPRKWRQ
jgi:hypothetical protein